MTQGQFARLVPTISATPLATAVQALHRRHAYGARSSFDGALRGAALEACPGCACCVFIKLTRRCTALRASRTAGSVEAARSSERRSSALRSIATAACSSASATCRSSGRNARNGTWRNPVSTVSVCRSVESARYDWLDWLGYQRA